MRETSALYKALRTEPGAWYEVRVTRGAVQYGPDRLKSCTISSSLFPGDGPQIGGTVSSQCRLVLVESAKNWPRMAKFQVDVRLCSDDNTRRSEWISMGIFYTDERSEDKYGNLTITGYDGMLLLEQSWTDKISEIPTQWPITAYAAGQLMVKATGIQIDQRSYLDDTVPFVGLDTTSTARDVYKNIAAAMGGNWQMTPEGKMLLVRLQSSTEDVHGGTSGVYELFLTDHNGNAILTEKQEEIVVAAGSYLGLAVMSMDFGQPLEPVSGVELESDGKDIAKAGTSSGYVLKGRCVYSDSRAADLCLSETAGFVYRPFSAGGALLDPAAETGDMVALDGVNYQIVNIDWSLGPFITCELSAPLETEVDHEYTVQTEAAKSLQKALAADEELERRTNSYIQQTAESIITGVSETYATKTDLTETSTSLSSEIRQTAAEITSTVNQQISSLQDQIDGVIETWSGSEVPSLTNYPASEWSTDTERDNHIGDLYVVDNDGGDYAGFYYRFERDLDGTYSWAMLEDSALTKAMAAATEALERATATQEALARNYSTTVDMNSAIRQSASEITQSVSQTYSTKTEAQGYADAVQNNAANDATNKANAAVTSANNYTNTALQQYSTTSDMNSVISQTADRISQSVSETYATKAELGAATDGTIILQTPYTYANGKANLTAVVYRNGTDVTSEFDARQFEWWLHTESTNGPQQYAEGKSLTVDSALMGYGGVVICRLYTKGSEEPLTTHTGVYITTHTGAALNAVPVKGMLEVQTALYQPETIEKKFAQVSVETDEVKAEVTGYVNTTLGGYSTTEQMNSAIRAAMDEINLSVSKSYATQTDVDNAKKVTITDETIHYLATTAGSGVTKSTAGWGTSPQTVTNTKRYLWTYSTYTYGDGSTKDTSPVISGVYGDTGDKGDKGDKGDTGVGISSITEYYALNNSTTAPADSSFSTGIKTPTASNRYLWNYELITYTNSTTAKTDKHIAAVYGETGNTGNGIVSITEYYALSTTTTAPANSAFSSDVKAVTPTNKYLWNYEVIKYTDNSSTQSSKHIIGVYGDTGDKGDKGDKGDTGDKGNTGTGISSVTPLYYSSSSATAPSGPTSAVTRKDAVSGAWTQGVPALTSTYKYLYTCDQVLYDNGAYKWTTVVADNAINDLSTRMSSAELKITDSAIVSTVRNSTGYQDDLSSKTDAKDVESIIEQKADSIRLKAEKIAWESEKSSMTEDGTLTCQNANISGNIVLGGANNTNGTLIVRDSSGNIVCSLDRTGALLTGNITLQYNYIRELITTIETYVGNGRSAIIPFRWERNKAITQQFFNSSGTVYAQCATAVTSSPYQLSESKITMADAYQRIVAVQLDKSDLSESGAATSGLVLSEWFGTSIKGRGEYKLNISPVQHDAEYDIGFDMYNEYLRIGATATTYNRPIIELNESGIYMRGYGDFAITVANNLIRLHSEKIDFTLGATYTINGKNISLSSTSSRRYKHDITEELDETLDPHRLYELPVKQYVYNEDHNPQYPDMAGETLPGFIAEDVAEIYPAAVIHDVDGQIESWDERRILPGVLALVQEQKKQIDRQQAEIEELRAEVKALAALIKGA